jgi:hypothetical protein
MIRDLLIPALKREFPDRQIDFSPEAPAIAAFPASQPAVGSVVIYDDGDEATLSVEKISHGHFNPYDASLTDEEREKVIVEDVIEFLKALFSDRVLLHTSADHRTGGWMRLDLEKEPIKLSPSQSYFLWTKPYEKRG